jgi:hypothetical protein
LGGVVAGLGGVEFVAAGGVLAVLAELELKAFGGFVAEVVLAVAPGALGGWLADLGALRAATRGSSPQASSRSSSFLLMPSRP